MDLLSIDLVGGEATMIVMIDVTAAGVVFLWHAALCNENRSLEDAPNKQEKFFVKPIEN